MTTSTATRPSELQCQRTIVQAARLGGWLVHAERTSRTESGRYATAIQGDPGFPDLVLAHPATGAVIVAELKRKPNRVEPAQRLWLDALAIAGHVVVWWVPEDLHAITTALAAGRIPTITEESSNGG